MKFAAELGDYEVWRDGRLRDCSAETDCYRDAEGAGGVISQEWDGGTLRVAAGGRVFSCTVTRSGEVMFGNK